MDWVETSTKNPQPVEHCFYNWKEGSILLQDSKLCPPIPLPAFLGLIRGDGHLRAIALSRNAARCNALFNQVVPNYVGSRSRQRVVDFCRANAIRVPGDLDSDFGIVLQQSD